MCRCTCSITGISSIRKEMWVKWIVTSTTVMERLLCRPTSVLLSCGMQLLMRLPWNTQFLFSAVSYSFLEAVKKYLLYSSLFNPCDAWQLAFTVDESLRYCWPFIESSGEESTGYLISEGTEMHTTGYIFNAFCCFSVSLKVVPAVAKLVLVHFHWQVSQLLDR